MHLARLASELLRKLANTFATAVDVGPSLQEDRIAEPKPGVKWAGRTAEPGTGAESEDATEGTFEVVQTEEGRLRRVASSAWSSVLCGSSAMLTSGMLLTSFEFPQPSWPAFSVAPASTVLVEELPFCLPESVEVLERKDALGGLSRPAAPVQPGEPPEHGKLDSIGLIVG